MGSVSGLDRSLPSTILPTSSAEEKAQGITKSQDDKAFCFDLRNGMRSQSEKEDNMVPSLIINVLDSDLVLGVRSFVLVQLKRETQVNSNVDQIEVSCQKETHVTSLEWERVDKTQKDSSKWMLHFIPNVIGEVVFCISVLDESGSLTLTVNGNNPTMSFSEGEDWPVAVAADTFKNTVFISYMHHVCMFDEEGEFQREVVRFNKECVNDLAVNQSGLRIAISVSTWRRGGTKSPTHKYRIQNVRVYAASGTLMWQVGGNWPLFKLSILHLTFDRQGNVLVADKDAICRCARSSGKIERRADVEGVCMVSRMASSPKGHLVLLDAGQGCVHILDENFIVLRKFEVLSENNRGNGYQSNGLTGLSVDYMENIIISDCVSNAIVLYSMDGQRLRALVSEWDHPRWPLAVAASHDGHVFVADHGNACVKKYRYA